jgi:hypothetical protein
MKWFFLSILLVYLALDPGDDTFFVQLLQGIKRVFILMLIFLLVAWLIRNTQREQIISAIIMLLSPFKTIGLPTRIIALRLELVLAKMTNVQTYLTGIINTSEIRKNTLKETGRDLSGLYLKIIDLADQAPLDEVVINQQVSPTFKQWLLPACLILMFYLVHCLS